MFFVLNKVAGDGLVAELAELDSNLVGRGLVGPAAHRRPVGFADGVGEGRLLESLFHVENFSHLAGQGEELSNLFGDEASVSLFGLGCDVKADEGTCHDLGVECLGGSDAHLDVASAAGVDHPVDFEGEVRVPSVDDGKGRSPFAANQIHGEVGVGGGAGLADGDDQGVGHGVPLFIAHHKA